MRKHLPWLGFSTVLAVWLAIVGTPPAALGQKPAPPTGSVSGVIRWNESLGSPVSTLVSGKHAMLGTDWGAAFNIRVYTQSGPSASEIQSLVAVQTCSYGGVSSGDYVMKYTLGQLPLNMPLWVVVTDSGKLRWQGPAATITHAFQADGWGGKITLLAERTPKPRLNPQPLPPDPPKLPSGGGGPRPRPFPGPIPRPGQPGPDPHDVTKAGNNPTGAGEVSGVNFNMTLKKQAPRQTLPAGS
jgi:hypothetical protein